MYVKWIVIASLIAVGGRLESPSWAASPKYDSKLITVKTPGHAVPVDVDITGAKQLYLVVTDGGNGFACDWADWGMPRLVGPQGEKRLTDLKWTSASADWGQVRMGVNAEGGPLRVNGKPVEYGIGTHANSVIVFDLPPGYTRFKATAGLDNGGTDQQGGSSTSVRFLVFVEKPPQELLAKGDGARPSGGRLDPPDALAALDVGAGLQASIFAAEPLLLSPTNIDIDHRGRVWVCEVVNYRGFRNKHPFREAGDRILILEDTNGDGQADKPTTFYQGREIDSAHGICVLSTPDDKLTRAIVSAGDSVYIFTDDDGDLKADRKELLFTGIDGVQHDHGIHAFVYGPDGKLYFNFGNVGRRIKDKDGKPIVDRAGNEVNDSRKPYQEGMIFRCDLDGGNFETLAWNFRNNWEVCVDSFGGLWQSDNDDDGNRGVRINYVMEYGNYGYKDELTGAGWRTPRTGMHPEIPLQHWHQNDPGVIPNLLQTGAGSPTGICVYEGDLLPELFQGALIHCDAGPNIVRAYTLESDGAGYTAEIVDILHGARDNWFRPSDVCVAPDGSLIIADWYDPGVGGHAMGDVTRGRLFRITPAGSGLDQKYTIPQYDFTTPSGAVEALKSPNLAARALAHRTLTAMGQTAETALVKLWKSDNPRHRARALWLLGKLPNTGDQHITDALATADPSPDIKLTGIRLARQSDVDLMWHIKRLIDHPSAAVRRECLIALSEMQSSEVPAVWAAFASMHDGRDRWYLEALGIAARGRWDACLAAWLKSNGTDIVTKAERDIIWRSRAAATPRYLAKIIADPNTPAEELPHFFRAFDFQAGEEKQVALIELAFGRGSDDVERQSVVVSEAVRRLQGFDVNRHPEHKASLDRVLDQSRGTQQFIELVGKFELKERYPQLLAMAQEHPQEQLGVEAVRTLLAKGQRELLSAALTGDDLEKSLATADALATAADGRAMGVLLPVMNDMSRPVQVRRQAARGLGGIQNGAKDLLQRAQSGALDPALKDAVAAVLHSAPWQDIKLQAEKLFPLPATKNNQPLPAMSELLKRKGGIERGKLIFNDTGTCAKCHVVNGVGKEVGPNLSEIGKKLSRQALFESVLFPNAGISHNYETYMVLLNSGNIVTGVLTSETPESVSIKGADAIVRTYPRGEIAEMSKQNVSLMPADLQKVMTVDDLINVVEYLQTLKQAQK